MPAGVNAGCASDIAGGMTGWRRFHDDIDGPVMTGPYQGRVGAAAGSRGINARYQGVRFPYRFFRATGRIDFQNGAAGRAG